MSTVDEDYRTAVRELSDALIDAQRDIRVLEAIKWGPEIQEQFFASGCKELPAVDLEYYERRPLPFDPDDVRHRLRDLQSTIASRLGTMSPASTMMQTMCDQFVLTVEMLAARGTPAFATMSAGLYGTPADVFHVGGPTVADLAANLRGLLESIADSLRAEDDVRDIPAPAAVELLQARLDGSMGEGFVDVRLDDGIAADAAAGSDYIKVRQDVLFSERDLALLEAHEGWVHIGTTQNGLAQPVCTFLGKATPQTTVTQEGLAVLTEILSFRSHPRRLARIVHRVDGLQRASEGADFLEVFEGFRTDGLDELEAYTACSRIFRGSLPDEGPFTKDIAYSKGLTLVYVYVRLAIRLGRLERIPMLFCGKVDLLEMGRLSELLDEGLVEPPRFVAPPYADLPALASTIAFSRFAGTLDYDRLESDYARLL